MTGHQTRVNKYLPGQISRARNNKSPDEFKFLMKGGRNVDSYESQINSHSGPCSQSQALIFGQSISCLENSMLQGIPAAETCFTE